MNCATTIVLTGRRIWRAGATAQGTPSLVVAQRLGYAASDDGENGERPMVMQTRAATTDFALNRATDSAHGETPCAALDRTTLTDQELAVLAQGGDGEAFALLVRRHERGIYAFAYRFFHDPLDADDAVQETFARAYTRLGTYTPAGRFGSWLLAICAHWCIDALRARRRRVRTVALGTIPDIDTLIGDVPDPEEQALRGSGREEVQRWLAALSPEFRTILAMHYHQERTYGEIATALDLPLTTVRMRLFRARAALRTVATP
jgi:RNA polymerase sigma-70 factor (ECF subfamily)